LAIISSHKECLWLKNLFTIEETHKLTLTTSFVRRLIECHLQTRKMRRKHGRQHTGRLGRIDIHYEWTASDVLTTHLDT
jgi:hypothetical protein